MPFVMKTVLTANGWSPYNKRKIDQIKSIEQQDEVTFSDPRLDSDPLNQINDGTTPASEIPIDGPMQLFSWRGSRLSNKELKVAHQQSIISQRSEYFNHFPDTYVLTSKGHLQYYLKLAAMKYGTHIYDFFPRSWILTPQSTRIIVPYEQKRIDQGESSWWIGKPTNKSRGRGIKITKTLCDLADYVEEKDKYEKEISTPIEEPMVDAQLLDKPKRLYLPYLMVVQEYIQNPYLINGYKFDIRLYVLVSSIHPLKAHLYLDGLVRFCTKPYSMDDFDRLRHLTNSSIQDTVRTTSDNGLTDEERDIFVDSITSVIPPIGTGDFSKRDLRTFLSYLKHNRGENIEEVWTKVQNVITLTMLSMFTKDRVNSNPNCYELLGFDILFTDKLEVKLVEVNLGPSLSISSEVDAYVKQPLCEDLLTLVNNLIIKNNDEKERQSIPPKKNLLAAINNVDDPYVDQQRVGDFELIFPFSKEVEELSVKLNDPKLIKERPENLGNIITRVHERLDRFQTSSKDNNNRIEKARE
jgi:tubulin polyglutamylase TTLL2